MQHRPCFVFTRIDVRIQGGGAADPPQVETGSEAASLLCSRHVQGTYSCQLGSEEEFMIYSDQRMPGPVAQECSLCKDAGCFLRGVHRGRL